jgi:hypothetical protein
MSNEWKWLFPWYKRGNVRVKWRSGMFMKPLLVWKAVSITYFFVCACVGEDMHKCECLSAGVCLHACSLTYPVCHMWVPYFLCPLRLDRIFWHLINGTIFGKKLLNLKCVLGFSLQLYCNLYSSKKSKVSDIKFRQSPSSGAKLFHVDNQADIMKVIIAFCNSVNMPKNKI